jgi:hypothetical protein
MWGGRGLWAKFTSSEGSHRVVRYPGTVSNRQVPRLGNFPRWLAPEDSEFLD